MIFLLTYKEKPLRFKTRRFN